MPVHPSVARRRARAHGGIATFVLALLAVIGLVTSPRPRVVEGTSGQAYDVFRARQVPAAPEPTFSLHFLTEQRRRALVEAEAADLLPLAAAWADSAGVRRIVLRANRPLIAIGAGPGLFREWRFQYAYDGTDWVPVPTT